MQVSAWEIQATVFIAVVYVQGTCSSTHGFPDKMAVASCIRECSLLQAKLGYRVTFV